MPEPFSDEVMVYPPDEIVEEGVESIELSASSTFNRDYTPHDGRVKWFRDELGQLWVKYTVYHSDRYKDHVWPANRVVRVVYNKGAKP